jgi:hypothetical protein
MYDNDNEEEEENMDEEVDKNPSGLNQSEIVASLALDLLNVCQNIVNPITNAPFKVKIGKIKLYKTFNEMILSSAKALNKFL